MTCTRLRNSFLKKNDKNRQLFCKQRNNCVPLLRKEKKDYFTSLNEKHITENKCLWGTVKLFLSNKVQFSERMKLCEEDDTLIKEEVAMELNDFSQML